MDRTSRKNVGRAQKDRDKRLRREGFNRGVRVAIKAIEKEMSLYLLGGPQSLRDAKVEITKLLKK